MRTKILKYFGMVVVPVFGYIAVPMFYSYDVCACSIFVKVQSLCVVFTVLFPSFLPGPAAQFPSGSVIYFAVIIIIVPTFYGYFTGGQVNHYYQYNFEWRWDNSAQTCIRMVYGPSDISYFENVWLAGNFLKGTLDGVNVNFTGIR